MDQRISTPVSYEPACLERLASAWQGLVSRDDPAQEKASAHWDKLLNALLGATTAYISPAAVGLAFTDWALHLTFSPSRRELLLLKAWKKYLRWLMLAQHPLEESCCIDPLPQDKRFADPAWRRWPYKQIYQGFLLQQQWWHVATTAVPGMSQHHEHVVNFITRQILDMMAPSNFVCTNPVVQQATMKAGGRNLVRGFRRFTADLSEQLSPSTSKHLTTPVGNSVAVTPGKVIYRNRLIELIRYAPQTENVHSKPLLFVPAWIMKYYILDLSPHNSLVNYLVQHGHSVYMISWRNPGEEDRDLSMEDYRELGVMAAVEAVCADSGATSINTVGYCLGGTLLAIAAAAMARDRDPRINSISLFASQVDFKEPGELSLFIDDSEVNYLEACMWHRGYLDTSQMAGAFQLLRSNDLIWSRVLRSYLLDLPEPSNDLMAWNADATRMPYHMHSEYLRSLFLQNDLAEGRYRVGDRGISLSDIEAPVFCVATLMDHVAPWRSVYKIQQLVRAPIDFLLTSGGHNAGVVSPPDITGRHYQLAQHSPNQGYMDPDTWCATTPSSLGSWWPAWETWLGQRSGKEHAPESISPAICDAPGTYVYQR
jgi:polyhydroxyalkanoate synthase